MSDLKNIRRLLSADKNLPLVERDDISGNITYPAYDKMLENAKQDYIDKKQIPVFMSKFKQQMYDGKDTNYLADTKSYQSTPTVLDKILANNPEIDKSYLDKLSQRRMLMDAENPYDRRIDRTAINNQIIDTYLKDANPTLSYNLKLASKESNQAKKTELEHDNIKHLYNQAEKLLEKKGTEPKFIPERNLENNDQGVFSRKDAPMKDTIKVDPSLDYNLSNLGYKTSIPFHELLHSINVGEGAEISFPEDTGMDFSKSNKISKDAIKASNMHHFVPAKGTLYPSQNNSFEDNTNAAESAVYFNKLMNLIGKPIK